MLGIYCNAGVRRNFLSFNVPLWDISVIVLIGFSVYFIITYRVIGVRSVSGLLVARVPTRASGGPSNHKGSA